MSTICETRTPPSNGVVARARAGDERARERIVREMLPVAQRVARRFAGPQHPAEDLEQVATIGVLKAIERFEVTHEAAFTTYAQALMTGEVQRHVRDSRMVRIPRSIYEQVPRFQRARAGLYAELGREPSRAELAAELRVTTEDLIEVMDAATHAQHMSLDAAVEEAGDEFALGEHDSAFARVEDHAILAPMLSTLAPRERMVLDLRFEEGMSQSEIADGLGLSQTQVSRIVRGALAKLSAHADVAASRRQ